MISSADEPQLDVCTLETCFWIKLTSLFKKPKFEQVYTANKRNIGIKSITNNFETLITQSGKPGMDISPLIYFHIKAMACHNLIVFVILGVAPLTGFSNKGNDELGYAGGKT